MNMNLDAGRNSSKFPTPVLGDEARALYSKLYGSDRPRFIDIMDASPGEIAVISRMIAYLAERREG